MEKLRLESKVHHRPKPFVNCQGPFPDDIKKLDEKRYEHFTATVHYNFKPPNIWDDNDGRALIITAKGRTKKVAVENACKQILDVLDVSTSRQALFDASKIMRNHGKRNRRKGQAPWPGELTRMAQHFSKRNMDNQWDYEFQRRCHFNNGVNRGRPYETSRNQQNHGDR